jgi:hypothetical protein
VRMPLVNDVLGDLVRLPTSLRDIYMPPDLETLAGLWLKLIQLSVKLEDVLLLHFRPRRPPLSLSQLEKDDTEIWNLHESLPQETQFWSPTASLHLNHLKCYFNAVTITLHRSYMMTQPNYLTPAEQSSLKAVAIQRAKNAAAATTNIVSKLISLDMIGISPSMLVTSMMTPMQIHLFEFAHSEGLARQHACHNLNLYMIVLSHLKKTYWSADMQHNLFTECLKALETGNAKCEKPSTSNDSVQEDSTSESRALQFEISVGLSEPPAVGGGSFEDFFYQFNPFYNMVFDQR